MTDPLRAEKNARADEFRLFLQRYLINRCKSEPGFSLRSFARLLGIDPTAFSRMLSGKRKITKKMMLRFAEKLNLSPLEVEPFLAAYTTKRGDPTPRLHNHSPHYTQLTYDTFQAISTWYYLAILELTHIKHFKPEFSWIAKMLSITPLEAKIAVETLERLGFLERTKKKWIDKFEYFTNIQENYTNAGLREFQKTILKKAVEALDVTSVESRSQTGMTFCADTSTIAEARSMIQEFQRSLTQLMQKNRKPNAVYQLSVSLFPLTKDIS